MIIEIEYYKGDVFLFGKNRSQGELQGQLDNVERLYDRNEDNFTELLVRMYGWTVSDKADNVDYIYDRDVKRLYVNRY